VQKKGWNTAGKPLPNSAVKRAQETVQSPGVSMVWTHYWTIDFAARWLFPGVRRASRQARGFNDASNPIQNPSGHFAKGFSGGFAEKYGQLRSSAGKMRRLPQLTGACRPRPAGPDLPALTCRP